MTTHAYALQLTWEGNVGSGTQRYDSYGREYRIAIYGKPDLLGSADVLFRGVPELHNPEDLFLAAVSSCHMLAYLALCARRGISVLSYQDSAAGTLTLDAKGGGRFTDVVLRPQVAVSDPARIDEAQKLHKLAHEQCFIASSCNVPIRCDSIAKAVSTENVL
jgi:organic hydroperoxide reductase OsmC/OhrA